MTNIIRRVAGIALAAALFASLSFAQMGTFMGKVIGVDGKPLQNAVIKIERIDIKGNWQTKTNKKGEWIYSGMQSGGRYNISCEVGGRVVDTANNVRAQMGEPFEVNFDLKKVADKQAAMQKAMEAGQLTQDMARDMTPEQRAQMERTMKERSEALKKNKALSDTFNAAMAALQGKDFPAAIENFNKAAELDPKQYAVFANMAAAYEGLGATQTGEEQTATYGRSGAAYLKALEIKPDDAGLHNNYGLLLARMKKIDEARGELDKAAALNPTGAGQYYFNLGAIMRNTQQEDAALEAFKKCVAIDEKYANCWFQIGSVLSGKMVIQGDKAVPPEGMVAALEKYLAIEPNGASAEAAKGLLSVVTGTIETQYINPDAKKSSKKKK